MRVYICCNYIKLSVGKSSYQFQTFSCYKNSSITILLPQRNRLLYTESSLHMGQKDFSLSLIFCFSGQSSLQHCLTCSKYFLQVVWCCKSAFNQLGVAEKCDTTVEMNSSDDLYNSSDSLSLISVGDGDLQKVHQQYEDIFQVHD